MLLLHQLRQQQHQVFFFFVVSSCVCSTSPSLPKVHNFPVVAPPQFAPQAQPQFGSQRKADTKLLNVSEFFFCFCFFFPPLFSHVHASADDAATDDAATNDAATNDAATPSIQFPCSRSSSRSCCSSRYLNEKKEFFR